MAQCSMFPYIMLRIIPHGLRHNEFSGKDAMATERAPVQQSCHGHREKISREAMDSTLHKLSMIVLIAKVAYNKHRWV